MAYGYIDIGKGITEESLPEVENILVLTVVFENAKYKLPVSHYFCNALTGSEKAAIVKSNSET